MFDNVYSGRRVLVTGHTGFKGSWITAWLLDLGAKVAGFSKDIPTRPSCFEALGLAGRIENYEGDVRDASALCRAVDEFKPEIVFHLAAQALVRRSYADPVETFTTNAIGTLQVLECLRHRQDIRAAVFITSDKVYRNVEWPWGYRENDVLGGKDPYSGSKACAELVIYSYYHSFLENQFPLIASTRAGNVIGGGDWAQDRIVPDAIRAWSRGDALLIRNPNATRPWQHVLEPLSGYLWMGTRLWQQDRGVAGESFNFGPDASTVQPVRELAGRMAKSWSGAQWHIETSENRGMHEATLLKLSCDKALQGMAWRPVLSFDETVEMTVSWYRDYYANNAEAGVQRRTAQQIQGYCKKAGAMGLPWAQS